MVSLSLPTAKLAVEKAGRAPRHELCEKLPPRLRLLPPPVPQAPHPNLPHTLARPFPAGLVKLERDERDEREVGEEDVVKRPGRGGEERRVWGGVEEREEERKMWE